MGKQAQALRWQVNAADGPEKARYWSMLWAARGLVRVFAIRDVRLRYKQAALGIVWVVLQPVVSVAVFTLVFQRFVAPEDRGLYTVQAMLGMILWLYFSSAVLRSSEVLVENPNLVTKVWFPRMAAPLGSVLSPLADLAVGVGVLFLLLFALGIVPRWGIVAFPACLGLLISAALGAALWLSALNVKYRDVRHALGPALQIAFFATPVVYPAVNTGWGQVLLALNPMAGIVALARWELLGTAFSVESFVVSAVMNVLILLTGVAYFRHAERYFADVI